MDLIENYQWFSWSKSGSIENYYSFRGPRTDLSRISMVSMVPEWIWLRITMVFMVPEWIYRELPWFSWSKCGSMENYHGFHGPKVDLSESCTVSRGDKGQLEVPRWIWATVAQFQWFSKANWSNFDSRPDQAPRPPAQIYIYICIYILESSCAYTCTEESGSWSWSGLDSQVDRIAKSISQFLSRCWILITIPITMLIPI